MKDLAEVLVRFVALLTGMRKTHRNVGVFGHPNTETQLKWESSVFLYYLVFKVDGSVTYVVKNLLNLETQRSAHFESLEQFCANALSSRLQSCPEAVYVNDSQDTMTKDS